MKEDWTKEMKQKLEGHEMTPPAGLWEGISNQMGLEPAPAAKPTAVRKWLWAAAAVVLALVCFFAFYNFDDAEQPKLEAKSEPTISVKATVSKEQTVPALPSVLAAKPALLAKAETKEQAPSVVEQPAPSVEEQPVPSAEEQQEPYTELQQESQSEPQPKKQTYLPDVAEPAATTSQSESSSKWTVGLAGSNGLLLAANNYVNSTDVQPLYYDANPADYYTNSVSALPQAYTYTDVESKHHIPLRLGLSLQYQLNNRLALLSGISYTYMKSEFSYPLHSHMDYDQELSYLGIPVGLSWKVWTTEHFNIYLAGGTLIEKCIKAEVSEGEVNSRPWQWSVNAAVGAEYNFTRQFGVYFEPSLGYYFNDGTKLEHYYKEHPLAPSVQFGLRLHLK